MEVLQGWATLSVAAMPKGLKRQYGQGDPHFIIFVVTTGGDIWKGSRKESVSFCVLMYGPPGHMLDRFFFGDPTNYSGSLRTETNAYGAQSSINKAFNTYSPDGLWNPSWAQADRETLRKAGVDRAAKRDADITWGKTKENQ